MNKIYFVKEKAITYTGTAIFKSGKARKVYDGTPLTSSKITIVLSIKDNLGNTYSSPEADITYNIEFTGIQIMVGKSPNSFELSNIHWLLNKEDITDKIDGTITKNYGTLIVDPDDPDPDDPFPLTSA